MSRSIRSMRAASWRPPRWATQRQRDRADRACSAAQAQQGQRDQFNDSQETLVHARRGYRRQAVRGQQRPGARHGEGSRRHQQLLHRRLLQHEHKDGWQVPARPGQVHSSSWMPSWITAAAISARRNFDKFTSTDKEDQLQQALMLGDPITDLSLNGEIDYFRLAHDRYFVPFSVKIPGSEIALAKSKGAAVHAIRFHRPGARRAHETGGRGPRLHPHQAG